MNTPEKEKNEDTRDFTIVAASISGVTSISLFGPCYKKVRFRDEEAALRGFGLLLRSGGVETFGENVYGLSSARQIELLKKSAIPFEVVE